MRIAHLLLTILLPLTCVPLSSCIYQGEGDCTDNLVFTIENDWQAAPSASPGGMAYIFFPDDGSVPWRYDFPGREAGEVDMATGKYSFLSYNDDTYNVRFREGGYDSYEAYTDEADILGTIPDENRGITLPRSTGEPVRKCPDMMWGCAYCYFSLDYDGVSFVPSGTYAAADAVERSRDYILTARQRQLTARYSFRIEKIANLSGVKSMSAALSGMAAAMMLASGEKRNYPSTLPLKAAIADSTTVGGDFYTFGIPESPTEANILSLFVVIKDGRRFSYEFDVTNQVRTAPDPMDVHIIVNGPELEIPDTEGDTAFDVNVDGWTTVTINFKS